MEGDGQAARGAGFTNDRVVSDRAANWAEVVAGPLSVRGEAPAHDIGQVPSTLAWRR